MANSNWGIFFVVLTCVIRANVASRGDTDTVYASCVGQCEQTGCVGKICLPHCNLSSNGDTPGGLWYKQEPVYMRWKQWDCQTDCRYYCMLDREKHRAENGLAPVKYHGKWPFTRVYGFQEPASVALSALNLAMHFQGWLSFFILLYYKLPLTPLKKPYYEYAALWHIYGLLALNSWFWSAVFHTRVEHESLCCHGCCTASYLVYIGWYDSPSFSFEIVVCGRRRWPSNAAGDL